MRIFSFDWTFSVAFPAAMLLAVSVVATGCDGSGQPSLRQALEGRKTIATVGGESIGEMLPSSAKAIAISSRPDLAKLLAGDDSAALASAIRGAGIDGIVVETSEGTMPVASSSVGERLAAYAHVDGFRTLFLDGDAAYYEPYRDERFNAEVGEALAQVARLILSGRPPPPVTSFPEPLRRIESVEMMVLIRSRGEARLWRSARASSVARALTTAATTARDRWKERETAMGGTLSFRLPSMQVEVYVVIEDGTLLSRAPSFIDRVFTPEHGVAYEMRGASWKYSLPGAEGSSAVQAYQELFESQGLAKASLGRQDLRLYRMLLWRVGVSPAKW